MTIAIDREAAFLMEEGEKPVDYKYYLSLFKKNFYVVITFFIIVVTLASIYVAKIPDQYQAVAQIILERPGTAWMKEQGMSAVEAESWAEDYYKTQIEIMQSRGVLELVVREKKLNDYFETEHEEIAIQRLREMMTVDQIRGSRLFNIQVIAPEPNLAADLANAIARGYIQKNFEDSLYYAKEILNWLPQEGAAETITVKDPFGRMKQITRTQMIENLPALQTDPTIRELRDKRNQQQADLETFQRQYREKHPIIVKARANLSFLDETIKAERQRIIENLKSQAEGRMQLTQGRVIEEAKVPSVPIGPNRFRIVLIVGLVELFLSILFIFLLDYFDDTVHSLDDLERKGILLPFLGPIPLLKGKRLAEDQISLVTDSEAKSELNEAFRYLRVAINFSASPESLKTLVVTSCIAGEGKSFIAQNIAVSLALDGNRTLLIDSDLRRPSAYRKFRLDNTTGLSNYLTSNLDFDSVIKESFIENLFVVVSGPVSPNPAEILGSERMKRFLDEARRRFDRIILDCPPLMGIGDGLVLGNLVGHVILVVASGKTPADLIQHTQKQLDKAGTKIIGAVLNKVDMEKERYGGYTKHYYRTYQRYYHHKK
jgi:capsular exopolysaccharide synthesis family protein